VSRQTSVLAVPAIASDGWSSGTITVACFSSSASASHRAPKGLGNETSGFLVVGMMSDLLPAHGDDHLHSRSTRADAGADRRPIGM
jgi:hypothetical protein